MQTSQPRRRPPTTIPTQRTAHDTEIVDEMGALLDEIDGILEENAVETVRMYVQRGGQ